MSEVAAKTIDVPCLSSAGQCPTRVHRSASGEPRLHQAAGLQSYCITLSLFLQSLRTGVPRKCPSSAPITEAECRIPTCAIDCQAEEAISPCRQPCEHIPPCYQDSESILALQQSDGTYRIPGTCGCHYAPSLLFSSRSNTAGADVSVLREVDATVDIVYVGEKRVGLRRACVDMSGP